MANKTELSPDFCIIGAGSGGLSFAAGAVQMGASVVLVESRKMGGDCLNYGCVPSKALIAAAKFGHGASVAKLFGWNIAEHSVDFAKVHKHIQEVIKSIAPNDSVERFEKLGVKVVLDHAQFIDKNTAETKKYLIKAKRFVIATGSTPFVPAIDGLSNAPYLTNENIFELKNLPKHLVVIGGGPIGIEIAQAFLRLGSKVTVLEAFSALPKDDPEITKILKDILISEGMNLSENAKILAIKKIKNEVEISYSTAQGANKSIMASHLFVATGRRPNVQNLNLDAAHVKFSPRGIEVDANLKTSNPRIYAIGDCISGFQFTHVAGYHAGLVIRNSIFGLRAKVETRAIPWVTYTDPELAHVGFTELQLKEKKVPHKVLLLSFKENDRAQAERRTEGKIKVLACPKGYVLGVTILGLHAGELIYPWVIAIQNKMKLSAITSSIAPYPTLNEVSKRTAGNFYTEKIFSKSMKKVVRFIMKWFRR